MTAKKSYRVVYERDEDGWWVAHVPSVKGCHTQGRTIDEARRRIREALALYVDDADATALVDEVRLPTPVRRVLRQTQTARARLNAVQVKANERTLVAIRLLRKDLGLSVRDAGELLELSGQRIQQIEAGGRKKPRARKSAHP